jgi:hypothetical protein
MTFRPATEADLSDCNRIHREGIDGYTARLGMPPSPPEENPGLRRLHAHTLATDPSRFLVAERPGRDGNPRVVAFGSAVDRGPLWFLSMLFVEPGEQAHGVGTALLDRMVPEPLDGRVLATCTDSAQPVSNGLYASLGIVPRMPMFHLVGRPRYDASWPTFPNGVRVERIKDATAWRTSTELAAFDRALLGFEHPEDHGFVLDEPRHCFAIRDGSDTLLGYGYAGDIGRLGPLAVSDPALLAPLLGQMLTNVVPRGASAIWLQGAADEALASVIRAGMRIEGFPVLIGWSRPFVDFARYVPISPGLV